MERVLLIVGVAPGETTGAWESLRDLGAELVLAEDADDAFAYATSALVEAIVVLHDALDETPGELVELLSAALRPATVPFVWVSASSTAAFPEGQPVVQRGRDELLSAVERALGREPETGGFADGGFAQLVERLSASEGSGLLVAYYDDYVKKVLLARGHVVFCGSNEPSELVGQACIRNGVITEDDLLSAMAQQRASHAPLGKILKAMHSSAAGAIEETIQLNFREGFLELYLWDRGQWAFRDVPEDEIARAACQLPLAELHPAGVARAAQWPALKHWVTGDEQRLRLNADLVPAGFPSDALEERLAELLAEPRNLEQLTLELRGRPFALVRCLGTLHDAGALEVDAAEERPTIIPEGYDPHARPTPVHGIWRSVPSEQPTSAGPPTAVPVPMPPPGWSATGDDRPTPVADAPMAVPVPVPAPVPGPPTPSPEDERSTPVAPAPLRATNRPPDRATPTHGILRSVPSEPPETSDVPTVLPNASMRQASAVSPALERAAEAISNKEFGRGKMLILEAMAIDPMNARARALLARHDSGIAAHASTLGLTDGCTVRLAVPLQHLMDENLTPDVAFLLSRLGAQGMRLDDLRAISPLPTPDVLSILIEQLMEGTIAVS